MTLQEMKELERKHGSGWRFQDNTEDKTVSEEVVFLNAFLGLRKELLALWEACDTEQFHCCLGDIAEEALDALNAKAAAMDA